MGKFCMNCGAELAEDDKFCQSCGEKIFDMSEMHEAIKQASVVPAASQQEKTVTKSENSIANIVEDQRKSVDSAIQKVVTAVPKDQDVWLKWLMIIITGRLYSEGAAYKRSIWQKWILSIITMGVYDLIWTYFFVKDIRKMAGENAIMHFVPACLLTIVTLGLYGLYYYYKMGAVVNTMEDMYNVPGQREDLSKYIVISFVLGVVSIVLPPFILIACIPFLIFQYKMVAAFNRAVDYYGGE